MLRSPKHAIVWKSALALAAIGGVYGLVRYSLWLVRVDPFATYRPASESDESKDMSVEYKNVTFELFDDKTMIATCDVDEVKMRRDRQIFEMHGIKNGKMTNAEGGFSFETAVATYERRTKTLSALKGAKIWTPDLNLKADGFSYYQKAKTLQTVGKVTGDFYGGTILAHNLRYNPVEKSGTAGPFEWTGSLAKYSKDAPVLQGSTKPWNIKGNKFSMKGDEKSWSDGRATDGDIILLADQVTHNTKTDVVTATGNVKYYSAKANLTCEKAVIYRKEKRADLSGNITMLVKPKDEEKLEEGIIPPFRPVVPESIAAGRPAPPNPGEKAQDEEVRKNNLRKYPTQIWAEKIVYYYAKGSRRALVSGSPQARQDLPNGRWRHIWTNTAAFDVEADKLRLNSTEGKRNVRLITSIGDDLTAKWLLVSTKENEDDMEGEEVDGTVISDDDDINNRGKNTPPPTTGGGTGGGLRGNIGA